jgi:glycosyltransferase involved in cell wall biosynthesis
MRILLTATASYAPPRGGATRSNLVWLNALAQAGHQCRVVCGPSQEGAEFACHPSIRLLAVEDPARRIQALCREIAEFAPDWVLVSSEDLGHALLREAHRRAAGRIVYLAHTPQFFPFGAASWNAEPDAACLVNEAAGIVVVGRHMAEYVERYLGRPATVIHPPIYGRAPFPRFASGSLVTMINPCAVKGISLFVEIARRFPDVAFGALPGWGTTAEDGEQLDRLPNVRRLPHARDIDEVLAQTRVLLMPSLWYEGFGLIVMEAMLRGIPVVASDAGGLREAKRGTGYVIPVRAIERYQQAFDELGMPRPVVPANDAEPWVAAARGLLSDGDAWERESAASRAAAEQFVAGLDAGEMERFLLALEPARAALRVAQPSVESLSPAKRALLLERLRKRGAAH